MKRIGIYIVIVVCILSCISSRRNLLTETRLMLVDTRATEHTLWYTQLLSILRSEGVALNYVCTWSGFSPYKGHPAAADFYRFKRDTLVLFADEIPNFYTWH